MTRALLVLPCLLLGLLVAVEPPAVPMVEVGTEAPAPYRLAVLGDSLSMSYAALPPLATGLPARSWTDLLAGRDGIDLGLTGPADAEDDDGAGFRGNWSRSGLSAEAVVETGLDRRLAAHLRSRPADAVVIQLGNDDLAAWAGIIVARAVSGEEIAATADRFDRHLGGILGTLRQDSRTLPLVLCTLPDWSQCPLVRQLPLPPGRRRSIANATAAFNERVRQQAVRWRCAVADLHAILDGACRGGRQVAGVRVDVHRLGGVPEAFFMADGIHPTPLVGAWIANAVLASLDGADPRLVPWDETAIARLAGLPVAPVSPETTP